MTKRWASAIQTSANASIAIDRSTSASPVSISRPPMYIGLRTILYGPVTTKTRGASNGAGVPSPRKTNSATQLKASATPHVSATRPTGAAQAGS